MKTTATIILIIGILITAFAGYDFVANENVVEIGQLEINKKKSDIMKWSPAVGIAAMLIGGGLFLVASKKV